MRYTIDQTHVRAYNKRIILDQMYHCETVSRADLSRKVHISKSAMTENISALLETGIIHEVGEGKSMSLGGRKPILLELNKEYCYIIAIELNFEDPIFVLSNLGGEILNRLSFSIAPQSQFEERLALLQHAIDTLLASKQLDASKLAMIAISTPGVYLSNQQNYRISPQFRAWQIPDLKHTIEKIYQVNTLIVNDVNAAALGELNAGIGRHAENLFYISCGLGLGAGLIINGQLYEGSSKAAGEIAYFYTEETAISQTTLESHLNIAYLFRIFEQNAPLSSRQHLQRISATPLYPTFKDLSSLWQHGDVFMKECIETIGNILARVICNHISLLNCDRAIFGGEYLVFAQQLLPIINDFVQKNAFLPIEVLASELGRNAGIRGLLALSSKTILDEFCHTSL